MNKLITLTERNIWQAIEDYKRHTYSTDILTDISGVFVNRLAEDSVIAKTELRKLFSLSPAWNEDLQSIIINGSRTHNSDSQRIYSLAHSILDPIQKTFDKEKKFLIDMAINFFSRPNDDPTDYIAAINNLAPKAYKSNRKKSRIFRSICDALGVTDESAGSEFQKLYAQLADELSAKKIDFKLFVSINPAHFLTMSNPKNDSRGSTLTSCHSLNSTDYTFNNGCSGYARDNVTFIVFTVADPDNPETLNNRKTTRQIFAYRPYNGLLLQSRLYNTCGGTYGTQAESKVYRDLIQREISQLECAPNLWKTYTYFNNEHCTIHSGEGFGGYTDWYYKDFDAKISIRNDKANDYISFTVGTYGLCICCAEELDEGLYCPECKPEYWKTCEVCGEHHDDLWAVHSHDGYEIEVCEECLSDYTCCDDCGDYYPNEDMIPVGDYHYVCQRCFDQDYGVCDYCSEAYLYDDMYTAVDSNGNEITICESCKDYDYMLCDECERYVHKDDATKAINAEGEEVTLCPECRDKNYQEFEDCEGVFHDDLMEDGLCPDCHDHYHECATCGELKHEDDLQNGLCHDCANKKEEVSA